MWKVSSKENDWVTVSWKFRSGSSWTATKYAGLSAYLSERTLVSPLITEDVAGAHVRKWEIAQAILRGLDLAFPTKESFLTNTVRIVEGNVRANAIPRFVAQATHTPGDAVFVVPYLE